MRYLVRIGTSMEIEGSKFNTDETFISNAKSAGFAEDEVEILTEEEYLIRKELDPMLPRKPTEIELLKEENIQLKTRLYETEIATAETSSMQEELIELLIEMGVI